MKDVFCQIGQICLWISFSYAVINILGHIIAQILIYIGDRQIKASKRVPEKKVTSE